MLTRPYRTVNLACELSIRRPAELLICSSPQDESYVVLTSSRALSHGLKGKNCHLSVDFFHFKMLFVMPWSGWSIRPAQDINLSIVLGCFS